jgi:hypothetical protein
MPCEDPDPAIANLQILALKLGLRVKVGDLYKQNDRQNGDS